MSDSGWQARVEDGLRLLDRHAWTALLGVLGAALILQIALLVEGWRSNPFVQRPTGDAGYYWTWAGHIAAGRWIAEGPFLGAPLYPYLVASLRAFGGSLLALGVVQALVAIGAGYLCGRAAALALRPAAGPFAAALLLFARDSAFVTSRALNSTLQVALVALFAWELVRWRKPASTATVVRTGVWLGLGALANPSLLSLVPITALWLWWNERAVRPALALAAVGFACVLPATLHNYAASGECIAIASHGGVTFAHGNAAGADGTYHAIPGVAALGARQDFDLRRVASDELGHATTWSETDAFFLRRGLAFWREQPMDALELALRKAYWFLAGRNYGDSYVPELERQAGLADVLTFAPLPVAVFALPGLLGLLLFALRDRRGWPLLIAALGVFATNVVFFYSPRYRLPAVPLLAFGAVALALHACDRSTRAAMRIAIAASFATAFAFGPLNARLDFDRLEPLRPMFESNLGQAWFEAGDLEAARPHLRAAVEAGAPYARGPLAELERRRGEHEAALALLTHPPPPREDAFARRTLGVLLAESGRDDEARATFERLLADYPDDGVAVGFLGNLALNHGHAAEALEHFDRALALGEPTGELCFNRAAALRALKREDEALAEWRRALALDPRLALARLALIESAASTGRWSEALDLARDGAALNPEEPWLACRWSKLLASVPDDALRDGVHALSIARELERTGGADQPLALEALAAALAETGDYSGAASRAERALSLARAAGDDELAAEIAAELGAYRASHPYRLSVKSAHPAK